MSDLEFEFTNILDPKTTDKVEESNEAVKSDYVEVKCNENANSKQDSSKSELNRSPSDKKNQKRDTVTGTLTLNA